MIATVNGVQLGYQDLGSGSPLVVLHGGFGTADMFGPNLEALAHGRSPAAHRPMRFEDMADAIAELIRTLRLEQAAVMGFSLGGGVALRTAIQHQELVTRLVLVSTPFKRAGWYREMTEGMDSM